MHTVFGIVKSIM